MSSILSYNSRVDRYTGTDGEGTYIEVDAEALATARQDRIRDGMEYDQADREACDPDGWNEGMEGFIPPAEHLGNRGWGGARPNSGPKPKPEDQTRAYISARIDPATHIALKAEQAKGDSLGVVLDRIVREWLANQP